MKGLVQNNVIYFETPTSEGREIVFSQFEKVIVSAIQEVETPQFEEQMVEVEVPFVSFDANGDEIMKYRKVKKPKKVQIGSIKETRSVIDMKAFDDVYGYVYDRLKGYLATIFSEDLIQRV